MDKLLTLQELADYLGVPIGTIYQWRHHGVGPPGIRVGRHVRVRESDLTTWLDSQTDRRREPVA